MKKIKALLFGSGLALTVVLQFASAVPAFAQTDQTSVKCGDNQVAIGVGINGQNCIDKGDKVENNVIIVWLSMIIKFLTVGVGLAATGGVVYGGYLYMAAQGNSGKIQKAISTIFNAIIGVILYALLFAIINFLLPGGVLK